MKCSRLVAAVSATLLGLTVMAAADEKADKAIKELDQAFAKINSYTARIESMTDTEFGPGHTQKMEMVGKAEWLRKGKKALMRTETKCNTIKTEDGNTTKTPSTITIISDGDFLYMLTEEGDQKTVIKSKAQSAEEHHPGAMFAQLRSYYDITLLPDERVNGAACHVFEMKMKPMEGMPPSGRQLMYYQKDNGVQIKTEGFDANGKLIVSSITTDVKINADISPDRFKFEIPEGAQVMDMTASQQPPAQAESKTEEPEKEQPKQEEQKKPEKKKGFKLPKRPKLP